MFCLLLIVLSLYLLDNTRLKKYIGYEKVKEYIKTDINIFGLAKGFFGDNLFRLYNQSANVSSTITSKEKYQNGYIVFQTDNNLYSTFIGSVINIEKHDNYYTVTISRSDGNIILSNILHLNVKLYQKIEADTLIGIIDGYYYYEYI